MGRIRSAWEIALEKTQDIAIDKAKLEKENNITAARTLAGRYLNYDEEMSEDVLKKEYEKIEGLDGVRDGIRTSIMQNLTLPSETVLNDRYERLETLASMISGNDSQVMSLMGQITAFLKQYPEHQKQLYEQLKEHFRPMLEEKAQQLREKYGQDIPLSLENDKEFVQVANKQLEELRKQYESNLDAAKSQLETIL